MLTLSLLRRAALTASLSAILVTTPAHAGSEVVPVDVGFGPAFHMVTGAVQDDQLFHYGLKLSLHAIVTQALIKKHQKKIPKKYRSALAKREELRIMLPFIPDTIYLSPDVEGTQMWGLNWRVFALDPTLLQGPVRFRVGLGLNLAYFFLGSSNLATPTHFFRPGLDLKAEFEFRFTESFLMALGWASYFYIPQGVGDTPFESFTSPDGTVWHVGQLFLQFHVRFPYETSF